MTHLRKNKIYRVTFTKFTLLSYFKMFKLNKIHFKIDMAYSKGHRVDKI